jgi:hypothetical protein
LNHHGYRVHADQDFNFATLQAVARAADLWATRVQQYVTTHGDRGSCVWGAGIAIYYKPPMAIDPEMRFLLKVPALANQGSLTWEESVNDAIGLLKEAGLDAFYHAGQMD